MGADDVYNLQVREIM